jgi:hypothetical protein
MAKRRYIVQDRWCEICSQPAAYLVYTIGDPGLKPVCRPAHGELLIDGLARQDEANKHRNQHSPAPDG